MKLRISLLVLIIAIVLSIHSTESKSVKSREKRSPNPQLGRLLGGLIGRFIKTLPKDVNKIVALVKKNPGTVAAGAAVGVGIGGAVALQQGKKQCVVYIKRDLPEIQPVFLTSGTPGSLKVPVDGKLVWMEGESSQIACPSSTGTTNYISGTVTTVNTIKCVNGLFFEMNGNVMSISTITCDFKSTGNFQLQPTSSMCPAISKAIGFNVEFPTGYEFLRLFYTCFNDADASVLFTHHVILGREIEHKCTYKTRPEFKAAGFTERFFVSAAYTQASQRSRLADLFSAGTPNSVAEANNYLDRALLQKGHLTPDADEIFNTWRWATYFFINVAPMWDSINMGNWKKLEDKVRLLAAKTDENLEIYTGTYGTLELCTTTNYCVPFTLVNGGIPVPKWLWKIVKSNSVDAAIALVVSNNPFSTAQPICGSPQDNYRWHEASFDQFQIGQVSYCKVKDLKDIVTHIPDAANAANILAYQ